MQTRNTNPKAPPMNPALSALVAFANQRPNLQFCNYGNRNTYAQEARAIRADLARFNRALSDAIESGTTDADLLSCVDKGGRLQLHAPGTKHGPQSHESNAFHVEYTPGQYFPTEYRKAASNLLEKANAHARELADELNERDAFNHWPFTCIDWQQAADELRTDYTVVEIAGKTYLYRE